MILFIINLLNPYPCKDPTPKCTAAKAAPKMAPKVAPKEAPPSPPNRPQPDPPRGIPASQASLIALAVRRQHLAEVSLGLKACGLLVDLVVEHVYIS